MQAPPPKSKARRRPFLIASCTIFLAGLFAISTYGDNPAPGRMSWTLSFGPDVVVEKGSHTGPRADAMTMAFAGVGEPPELNISSSDQGTYTHFPPQSVCAFVSDDRSFIAPSDLGLDDVTFLRTRLPALSEARSVAFYLNMLWTIRHQQRLIRLTAVQKPGWHGSWAKHENMLKMAEDDSCKIKADVSVADIPGYGCLQVRNLTDIRQQEYSFHDLRRRWGIHDDILFAVSEDAYPESSGRYNAGFLIMQNKPELKGIIQKWLTCPDEIPGCAKYKTVWMHDQGAMNDYIIPELEERGLVRALPCDEATGSTEHASNPQTNSLFKNGKRCRGTIVTHAWWHGKNHLLEEAVQLLAYNLLLVLEDAMDPAWI
ncbi:uncharacterized protein MKK02DRAFT_29115 [Dioszegia hungarica]|uniref:Uncharacterized protein n=1 Tax=Dioszegia hungarica TaxID=4972 RepID=A0AA38H210_9TREE|nr:uncharacterized protein MKK02DRAFT_29115 [Dioszegia hungarica]KAI9633242.1 hypothetical protein MKK02DRAFT_29115 [Dioszegia hungarica]